MDIKTLDYMTFVRLDVSSWAGRAKLRPEDLPLEVQNSLPPETLASLGSKKLMDPDRLKIFNTLKARGHSVLSRRCVSIMGGYATHNDRLEEIAEQLSVIAGDFYSERTRFLNEYVESSARWVSNFPGWENILLNAMPKSHELAGKFSFSWQAYQIQPATEVGGYSGNTLFSELSNLEQSVIEEVSRDIKAIYRDCFDGKNTVTRKAFRPLQTLIDKVRGLGFIHPYLIGLENVLLEAKNLGDLRPDDVATVGMIKSFLLALSTPQGIQIICEDFCDRQKNIQEVFNPFWAAGGIAPIIPVQSEQLVTPSVNTLPNLPPGWQPPSIMPSVPVLASSLKTFIEDAQSAIEAYEDMKLGIIPTEPVNKTVKEEMLSGKILSGGLW